MLSVIKEYKGFFVLVIVIIAVAVLISFASSFYYSFLGFERVKDLDGATDRGKTIMTNWLYAGVGLDTDYVSYEGINWGTNITIEAKGKSVEGKYFGYNTQDDCHYVYLAPLIIGGEKVYKISEEACWITANPTE
ncbi:hypothetical protein [Aminipila sp.]|uniref:hypothetical protein n=1 Tax=Aminipila sp. TaxID=2060095 RepID=UPI0028972B93|nr:hypothetical protein [Aminipila sp.]